DRAGVDERRRSAPDADRRVAPTLQPGRASPARERPAGRDEPGRPAAGAAGVRRGVSPEAARLHAPPQGEGRHDRVGADQWLAGEHVTRETSRVRPLLHRALVARLRFEDPPADLLARLLGERLLDNTYRGAVARLAR